MRRVQRSALLPYSAADVYAIVNDVERYPEFLKWCQMAQVVEANDEEIVARMTLAARGLKESLVTRNRLTSDRQISLSLVEGPFKHFSGDWTFTPLGDGCRVHLALEFELASSILSVLAAPFLHRVADTLVDAFSQRARDVLDAQM